MSKTPVEIFKDIQTLFRRVSNEVCLTMESYYIWRTLTFARSIPEVGKEQADETAKMMSICNDFFIPTEYAHLQTFIIGLMKFFDKDPQALSIASVVSKIERNKNILNAETFRAAQPGIAQMGAIKDDYIPIDAAVINHIADLQNKYDKLIGDLKDARDKQFAHTDIKTITINFVPNEIEAFIVDIQETVNKMSNRFDQSTTIWDHLKEDTVRDTQFLLENFARGEKERKAAIAEKWTTS